MLVEKEGEEAGSVTVAYELWEVRSGNLMESFDSERDALLVLADAIKLHGLSYVDCIMLVRGEGERSQEISSGRDLGKRALKEAGRTAV